MKIAIYCQDGSPLGVTPEMIYGRGVGGAELSMMSWAEEMALRGHEVTVYNNPKKPSDGWVAYKMQSDFDPTQPIDVFIVYRSPNPHIRDVNATIKIHWSMDQQTMGDYARDIVPFVDKIVCISPYHMDYYRGRYRPPPEKICFIGLGVRQRDYLFHPAFGKDRNRLQFIYCSVPQRGLMEVARLWPKVIESFPKASLIITSDYTLWGTVAGNENERAAFMGMPGVKFLAAVPRKGLVKLQLQSGFHLYPCTYEELFCISAAECQYAGAIPLTSDMGALATTNEGGYQIEGNPYRNPGWHARYLDLVLSMADKASRGDEGLEKIRRLMTNAASYRFSWDRICTLWENMFAKLQKG